ncbi:hypothetical protein LTR74_018309, partial [Friedmanniomyces endolithicus]
ALHRGLDHMKTRGGSSRYASSARTSCRSTHGAPAPRGERTVHDASPPSFAAGLVLACSGTFPAFSMAETEDRTFQAMLTKMEELVRGMPGSVLQRHRPQIDRICKMLKGDGNQVTAELVRDLDRIRAKLEEYTRHSVEKAIQSTTDWVPCGRSSPGYPSRGNKALDVDEVP